MNRIACTIAVALLLTSCTHHQPALPPTAEDPSQFTTRWIPSPAVDLMSPEGTFIRATTESWRRAWGAQATGTQALRERGFPGFEHAYNNSYGRVDDVGGYPDRIVVGTEYNEVVSLRRDGDRITADVCQYASQTATKLKDGQYTSLGGTPSGGGKRYIFGPDPRIASDKQRPPMANQRGSARVPSDNVFGTWVLFEMTSPDDATERGCNKLAPGTPEGLPSPYIRAEAPSTLPPDPGWPQGSSA